MSDIDAGQPDAAPVAAPDVVSTPNPISTEREPVTDNQPADEGKPAKAPTAREALERAAAKVEADADPAKPVKSDPPQRADDGKFAAKDGAKDAGKDAAKPADAKAPDAKADPARQDAAAKGQPPEEGRQPADPAQKPASGQGEAPARFSADAKAAWAAAPEPVKAEVARMERELTQGIEKYRGDAEAFEPVRKFHDMAKASGNTLDKVLETYVGLETMIDKNPIVALERICEMKGFTLRQVAEHVMGQAPDAQAAQRDSETMALKREIHGLKQQLGQVSGTLEQQKTDRVNAQVAEFADKHPRFDELAQDIAFFIESGRTTDLAEAYSLAERLNPAPVPASAPKPAPDPSAAQTRKGEKSINGAPTPGSDPVTRQPSSSIRESLLKAAGRAA
jgi:hypothetical protein